ncbi:HupE/UreJ protein [Mucilaginibacter frigoritolerans]|uniref:HupE/UreJ protein n=1 Tax=Mucilaginibacter frigoritolerans TaxID=652788 RepID=A0A562UC36_9SPHI|nr:HupE/UreJ family protein [Mucilaginibacter frigoritolerans]TWJ03376.1 HupE/UreJ protein [Mucilaginibacter frigoritolerans]
MYKNSYYSSCRAFLRRLLLITGFITSIVFAPSHVQAHQAPYTAVFLDVSPDRVGAEMQIPLTELEFAFGHHITANPETLLERLGPELKAYLLLHTHAYKNEALPWTVNVTNMAMVKEQQVASGPPFWELRVNILLLPRQNEDTRKFMLAYDGVVHQVINHVIFVAVRNDWETGRSDSLTSRSDPMTIRISSDNKVHPLEINIVKGNSWTGFKNMVSLGMEHIKTGTDHLLFLLVLLLPATLVVKSKRWAEFGGVKYSLKRLLKIVTAFTAGHSLTLLLGATGVLVPPSQIIEVLIAVSILVSAIHALIPIFPGKEYYVSGGFGLIHGMAFASILYNMQLHGMTLILSILGFNIGIEMMQLFIVALIIPWLIVLSRGKSYAILRVSGAIIAVIASFAWIIERISGRPNVISAHMQPIFDQGIWFVAGLAGIAIASLFFKRGRRSKIQSRPLQVVTVNSAS